MARGFGFGTNESSGTNRTGTGFDTARFQEFLKAIHGTLGGPFTVGDLFEMAPRSQSLFGGSPTGPIRPGGGFNLGFGTPPSYEPPAAGGPAAPPTDGTAPPPTGGTPPAPDPGKLFKQSDVEAAWNDDPEKRMDLPRLLRQSGVDPNGFTLEEFQDAVGKANKYGFSGRSTGNFGKALALLQNIGSTEGTFGGGKGTGVF